MKRTAYVFFVLFATISLGQEKYQINIDLTRTKEDKLPVEILTPKINAEEVEYHMPKIVPGTYSISDFGRFIVEFKAFDKQEKELKVKKISTNKWIIEDAFNLFKITYWVEDSFDDFSGYGSNKLFEPGGTCIDKENEVYVLNTFGFIGYLEGEKFKPFELTIQHSEAIKGATSLEKMDAQPTSDTYIASNYNFLADAPIMYSRPNFASKEIAGANVLISIYTPNNLLSAEDILDNIDDLMEAQAAYLGGKLPVDRYVYLIYLFDKSTFSGAWGALEHSYSSFYSLPEMNSEKISSTIRGVAAHEFFHIVTPLNIHSEEIHHFNYIEPKMSQHLWLYEGVTEYSSIHVQVKHDLYGLNEFLEELRYKMLEQEEYKVDIPYTTFSQNILEPENESRYGDVYAGGALIAMCLDLTILKSTDGKKDLQWLLRELSIEYGPQKPFKDDELFDKIQQLTNQEVGHFLKSHISDTEPLPYKKILGWAGINYRNEGEEESITAGKFTPELNDDREIYIADTEAMNDFGNKLNLQTGDVLLEWNGDKISLDTFSEVMEKFYTDTKKGDKVEVMVRRESNGKIKKKKLRAKAMVVTVPIKYELSLEENPTEDQIAIRTAWLGK